MSWSSVAIDAILYALYTAALTYIQQTIADGWKLKDAFKMEDYTV